MTVFKIAIRKAFVPFSGTIAALLFFCVPALPQDCSPPEIVFNKNAYNIFTFEQEMYLGEAMAERFQRDFRVIRDEAVNSEVRRIGEKIVKHLPPTNLKYEFFVVDLPEVNAFTMAGGKVYITRKLVAFVRNEAELAGIIAHELGHNVVRHSAIDTSKLFKEILKVEQVSTRQDIFEKYNRLIDQRRTKRVNVSRNHEGDQQLEADRIAVFAMAAAGYDPNEFSVAWDRLAQTKGKTGNWFSDLFGSTKPEQKRLREIIKAIETLSSACVDKKSELSVAQFKDWQSTVINFANLRGTENVPGLLSKMTLTPLLRSDLQYLQFSQDGKYILGQDDSGITILQKKPLKLLFRIDSPEALPASFTPDSKSVVFNTSTMRVEKWSIATQRPTLMREVFVLGSCWQTALSNDGNYFVCYARNGNLEIIDVESNEPIFTEKKFYIPDFIEYFSWLFMSGYNDEIDAFEMAFSPNGRYFVAGRVYRSVLFGGYKNMATIGFDLVEKQEIKLGKEIKDIISSPFTFYTNDKIIGQHRTDDDKSGIFEFPSGKRLEKFLLRGNSFTKPHKGDYLLVRPVSNAPVGVYDLKDKKFTIANKKSALAIYDDVFVAERTTGEIGVYDLKTGRLEEGVNLPESRFGNLRVVTTSPDLDWLVVSDRSRGAVWNLQTGERVFYLRGFRGAFFDQGGQIFVDFPATGDSQRDIAVLDVQSKKVSGAHKVEQPNTKQMGKYLVTRKSGKEKNKKEDKDPANIDKPLVENPDDYSVFKDGVIEVRDVRSNDLLWSREFEDEMPVYGVSPRDNTMTFRWRLKSKAAKNEIKKDERMRRMSSQMGDKDGDYYIQIVEADSGKLLNQTLIETGEGSFRVDDMFAAGDWLTILDSENRILLYSMNSGELRHRFFGDRVSVDLKNNLAAVENISGQIAVYDLSDGEKIQEMTFKTPVSYLRFAEDGKRLFVLTAEQEAFMIDTAKIKFAQK